MLMGAPGGIAENFVKAAGLFASGQWGQGIEKVLPTSVGGVPARDFAEAWNMSQRGVVDYEGYVVDPPERVTTGQLVTTAFGFRPSGQAEEIEKRTEVNALKKKLGEGRSRLMKRYAMAVLRGEDTGDLVDEMKAWNGKNPNAPITRASLRRSLQRRKTVQARISRYGANMSPSDRVLAQDVLDAYE
jgi:hypothetical protein